MGRTFPGQRVRAAAFWLLVVLLVLWNVVPPPPAWVESVYSRGLYRWISAVLVPLGDLVPFSLVAVGLLLLALALPVLAVRSWRRSRRESVTARRWVLGCLRRTLFWGVVAYGYMVLVWGANYRRQPIEAQLELEVTEEVQENDIRFLVLALQTVIHRDVPPLPERDAERALGSLRRSLYDVLKEWQGVAPVLPGKVKRLPPGLLLSFGTSGTMLPLFLEVHTDGAMTEVDHLGTVAHELAHAAGFNGEADADLVGFIAGLRADDAYARYSVALQAFERCAGALETEARKTAHAGLPPQARRDLEEMHEVAVRYARPALMRLQRRSYDLFLRSQGVKEGVRDYSRAVQLLVRAAKKGRLSLPSLRGFRR